MICYQIYKPPFLKFQHSYVGPKHDLGYELQDSYDKMKSGKGECMYEGLPDLSEPLL